MKKLVVALLAACAVSSAFANGAKEQGSAGSSGPIELRMSWWGSDSRHEATLKALDLYMQRNPHVKVVAEYQGFNGYHDKLITQIYSGTEPDLYQLDNNVYFADLAMTDRLTDLKPFIDQGIINLDDYPKDALDWATYNGTVYGVPSGLNGPVMYYNKAIFDKTGVAYPTDDWTWKDLEEAGKKIHAADPNLYGMKEPSYFLVEAMMRQKGGWIADPTGAIQDFSKEMGEVFAQLNEWRANGVIPPLDVSAGRMSQNDNLFLSGKVAIEVNHVATFPMQSAAVVGQPPCAVAMIPESKTAGGVYMLASMPWTIGKGGKHKEEAAKLLNFLINDPDAGKILMTQRGVPGPTHIREAITPLLSDVEKQVINGVNGLVECTKRIDYEFLMPGSAVIENVINEESSNTGYGLKTPQQAGMDCYKRIKDAVEAAKKK